MKCRATRFYTVSEIQSLKDDLEDLVDPLLTSITCSDTLAEIEQKMGDKKDTHIVKVALSVALTPIPTEIQC